MRLTFINSQTGWIVGKNGVILKTTTGGVVTGFTQTSSEIPDKFSLSQNYPNPFNPSTQINYELPITNYVSLKVYDNLGNEVETLVAEKQNTGSYSVDFNATSLPSGIYFYKLTTEKFSETKKMILIK
ncbi:MAG: T9SS type A sorting domain-containing protein [Ignavibacteria bacterium]|nr:T9SS type A sorting domain-containing protein [Ignavibacteria bacterium]